MDIGFFFLVFFPYFLRKDKFGIMSIPLITFNPNDIFLLNLVWISCH